MTQSPAPSPPPPQKPRLLGPWRTAFQWLSTLVVLLVPFVEFEGNSLLRLDFASLSLQLGGHVLPIESLWLFLLFCLAMALVFLLVTLAFGRAWCGWACPQTTLVDLVEWCARRIGIKVMAGTMSARPWQKVLLQLLYLGLALLVGANLLWYFITPYAFVEQLKDGTLHWAAWTLFGAAAAIVWLDLAFLRRLLCKEFCPYGRFQTVLVDTGTLTLRFHPDEAARCIRCGACVRACPTGIDIREGYQVECINCGRCLDACRLVMARRNQQGIIRYTFGLEGRGMTALFNLRTALVTVVFIGVTAGLVVASWQRSPVTLKVARNPVLLPRTVAGGKVLNFYSAFLVNRSGRPHAVALAVAPGPVAVHWRGPAEPLQMAAGEHRRIDFGLETAALELTVPRPVVLVMRGTDGTPLAEATLILTSPLDKPAPIRSQ